MANQDVIYAYPRKCMHCHRSAIWTSQCGAPICVVHRFPKLFLRLTGG